jgi:hypothetical protein
LIIAFSGRADNEDEYCDAFDVMPAVIHAAVSHWSPRVVVLDLRELEYQWGDWMTQTLIAAEPLPTAVVISDRNRTGLTSLVSHEMFYHPPDWLYETLEDALAAVVAQWDEESRI